MSFEPTCVDEGKDVDGIKKLMKSLRTFVGETVRSRRVVRID